MDRLCVAGIMTVSLPLVSALPAPQTKPQIWPSGNMMPCRTALQYAESLSLEVPTTPLVLHPKQRARRKMIQM